MYNHQNKKKTKLALITLFEFMVTFKVFAVPLPSPDQPVKRNKKLGVATSVTIEPGA